MDRLDARKACLLPRPPVPTVKFPFQGLLWTADNQRKIGPVRGLFFRGLEKGDPTWRGQAQCELVPEKLPRAGDSASLWREGHEPTPIVVMGIVGQTLVFRCGTSGSPLEQRTRADPQSL